MTQAEKVTEKIKKLLELATSPNEHEARRAMEMAQKLMIQFNIDEVDLNTANVSEQIIQENYDNELFNRIGVREQLPRITKTIGRIFGVFALFNRRGTGVISEVLLFGYPTNLKVAKYALDSILQQGALEYKAVYRANRSTLGGLEFWDGFAYGLQRKFESFSSKEANSALVVYDPVERYTKERSGGSFNLSSFDGSSREAGIAAGLRAEIRSGITSTNKGNLLK